MTALIEVETADFARVARSVYTDVGDPLTTAVVRTITNLQGCGAMAGSDPAGRDWAACYDRAAASALRASQDAINACYKLSAMFAQTARNYEAADAASTATVRRALASATEGLPDPCVIGLATELPTAAGGSGTTPSGWGLISGAVGYLWPDGHQGRLRGAAQAWRSSGDGLWLHSEYLAVAAIPASADRLPEASDMAAVCDGLYRHLREVAHVHYALADGCDQLAHHLDETHSAVEHELISLVEWTAGIETAGAIASFFTLGAAEAPTQAVEAARIARAAARIAELIQRFVALARSAAASIAAALERADRAAAAMAGLLDVRLTTAVVTQVQLAPTALKIQEILAIRRLGTVSGEWPQLLISGRRVEQKFKHAADFGVSTHRGKAGFTAFEESVGQFLARPTTTRVLGTYRGESVILSYDKSSRLAVVQNVDGTFVSGWRLRPKQLLHVVRDRSLGGG
jgi:hypothetical protein